jgi:hypothetical protein
MAQTDPPPNILEVLDGLDFPVNQVELVVYAEDHDASEEVLDQIQSLPDRVYTSLHDVALHLGRVEHQPGESNEVSSAPPREFFSEDEIPYDLNNRKL